MRKPDFFIIGAPKCGTTAMARYLSEHDRVFMSDPKEPHFFNTDFANRHTTDLETYLSYFDGADEGHLVAGEASVFYLYSNEAIRNILAFQPDARFIVMVRNPAEVAHAWHSQAIRSFGELVPNFEKAWRLQYARETGEKVPASCREKKVLLYGELASIGRQLQRLFDHAERERVLILLMEDMKKDAVSVYRKTLSFLGVPYDGRTEFPVHNANQRVRSPRLKLFIKQARDLKNRLGVRTNLGLTVKVGTLNESQAEREPLPSGLKAELLDHFADDIRLLESFTGRDLSHWRTT